MNFVADYAAAFAASAPQGALLLMRSVRSNKALLLTKVTKYCAQSENKRRRATFVFAGTVAINAEHLEHMSINS